MKIAVIGAGAMGMLFGSYLSKENDVILLDKDIDRVNRINSNGVFVRENGADIHFEIKAACIDDYKADMPVELLIVFVKSMFEREALESAKELIGANTYLMTLQNGEGHEAVLLDYADADHVIIGTTQDNSSIIENGHINHGGSGHTYIGLVSGKTSTIAHIADNFSRCGFDTATADNIKRLIWNKLFLNASASALTALFQTNLGFIVDNAYAWELTKKLICEAVYVANADGQSFDAGEVTAEIKNHLERSKGGYTSIYADIKAGHRSEVDTISGAVVKAADRLGIDVPNMKFVVTAMHAMEDKNSTKEL